MIIEAMKSSFLTGSFAIGFSLVLLVLMNHKITLFLDKAGFNSTCTRSGCVGSVTSFRGQYFSTHVLPLEQFRY